MRIKSRELQPHRLTHPPLRSVISHKSFAISHFRFNAWALFPDWQKDAALAPFIARRQRVGVFPARLGSRAIVLDRGAVVVDGPTLELLDDEGLMLAHGLERRRCRCSGYHRPRRKGQPRRGLGRRSRAALLGNSKLERLPQ